jgi:hypothetical protein
VSKNKKFEPSMGWLVAVNHQEVSIVRLAQELKIDPIACGQALENAGYQLIPDPFDIAKDAWKVLDVQKRNKLRAVPTMADVAESVTELDEEEMANE